MIGNNFNNNFFSKFSIALIMAIVLSLSSLNIGFAIGEDWQQQEPPWDPNPPETSLQYYPKDTILNDFYTFYFTGTDDVTQKTSLQYRHKLNNGNWSAWSTATNAKYENLAQGDHTFYVQAKDEAGNEDATAASATITYMEAKAYLKAVTDKTSVAYQKDQKQIKEREEQLKKMKKLLEEAKKKLNKAKNDQEENKYSKQKQKYTSAFSKAKEQFYKVKQGTPFANIGFMWPSGLENDQLSMYVNIQKLIKSKAKAKIQAKYKKLYQSYWGRYKKTSQKKLRNSYLKTALKYRKIYKKIKPVYYKPVKKVYLVQPTPNAWQTIQYSGGYGSYKYVGYGVNTSSTQLQQFTQGNFQFKFNFGKKLK